MATQIKPFIFKDNVEVKGNLAVTGTVSGITATMVGLGNVTNESKATMFTSASFTNNTTFSGELHGPENFVIDPAAVGDNTGTVIIKGNLQVDGTTTTINSTTLTIDDKNIVLASGAVDSAAADGAGISVDGASATLTYVHSGTKWAFNKSLDVTGTVIADGLTIDVPSTNDIIFQRAGGVSGKLELDFSAQFTNFNSVVDGLKFYQNGTQLMQMRSGDISFYNSAGNAVKFFWDASTERLGIGTDAPSYTLDVNGEARIQSGLRVEGGMYVGKADTASAHINAYELMTFNVDIDNDDSDTRYFAWYKNAASAAGAQLMRLEESTTGTKGLTVTGDINAQQSFRTDEVRHSIRPTLNLDFANSKKLDPRITFNRGSIGTYYDSKGVLKYANINQPRFDHDPATGESKGLLIEEARTNIFTYTNNPERWSLMNGGSSDPIANNIKSPDGTFNATSLIIAGSDPYFYQNNLTLSGTYTFSYWIKAVGTAIGKQYTTRITNVSTNSSTAGTLPSEWTRYTFTFTTGSTSTAYIGIEAPDDSPADGDEISIWGAQLELGAFATSLIPSTTTFISRASSATYYDETGILRTAPVNGARYGYAYDRRKWVETGLILEGASTNTSPLASTYNNEVSQNQVKTGNTTETTAPDGSYTATKFDVSATTSNSWTDFIWSPGLNYAGTTRTFSIWLKGTAGQTISIKLNGTGAAGSFKDITFTGSWQREFTTFTYPANYAVTANVRFGPRTLDGSATGTASIWYAWGAQVEVGGLTSYIYGQNNTRAADVASSVAYTRQVDTAAMIDSNFTTWWNDVDQTYYAEASQFSDTYGRLLDVSEDNIQRYSMYRQTSTGTNGINNQLQTTGDVWAANTYAKFAFGVSTSGISSGFNGYGRTLAATFVPYYANRLNIGGQTDGFGIWNGHIKKIMFYPERLTDAELQALTENN